MKWKKQKVLGKGSYGTVYLATPADSKFPKKQPTSALAVKSAVLKAASSLVRERVFLHKLRGCPNIVQCFGDDITLEEGQRTYNLMMEYASGGTLEDVIERAGGGGLPEARVAGYTAMLLEGISSFHERGIVHCDLKPDNVLVFAKKSVLKNEGDCDTQHILKIADFGLARRVDEKEKHCFGRKNNNRGALLYASPESVLIGLHEPANDVWSLGCIVFEMLTGELVWSSKYDDVDMQQLALRIIHQTPCIPDGVSETARDFLEKCFVKETQGRWTAKMLLTHPFIADRQLDDSSCGSLLDLRLSLF